MQNHSSEPARVEDVSARVQTAKEEVREEEDTSFREPWSPFDASLSRHQFFSPVTPIH